MNTIVCKLGTTDDAALVKLSNDDLTVQDIICY